MSEWARASRLPRRPKDPVVTVNRVVVPVFIAGLLLASPSAAQQSRCADCHFGACHVGPFAAFQDSRH
jgi:hypothetical protein